MGLIGEQNKGSPNSPNFSINVNSINYFIRYFPAIIRAGHNPSEIVSATTDLFDFPKLPDKKPLPEGLRIRVGNFPFPTPIHKPARPNTSYIYIYIDMWHRVANAEIIKS